MNGEFLEKKPMLAISNLIFALLSFVIAFKTYRDYVAGGSKNKKFKDFSIFFVLFAMYQIFLSYFLFFDNLYFAAWSYNLAVVIAFVMISFILRIALSNIGIIKKYTDTIIAGIVFIGIIVFFIQVYDFRLPIVQENGIIDWNANKISAKITSLSVFLVSLVWIFSFLKNFNSFDTSHQKVKASLLSLGGLFLGLSGLTTYYSYEKNIVIISHTFAFIGGFLVLATLLIYRKR